MTLEEYSDKAVSSIEEVLAQLHIVKTYVGSRSFLMQDASKAKLPSLATQAVSDIQEYQDALTQINPDIRLHIDVQVLCDEINSLCRSTYGPLMDYAGDRKIQKTEDLFREACRKCSIMKIAARTYS